MNNVCQKLKNKTILMDNARIHHSEIVKKCIIDSGNHILYNVAYNPDTNPIENCFSVLKNYVRKMEPTTEKELICTIEKSLTLLIPEKLKNMFNNSFTINKT
jgi:transposase